jgi:hypothetical protein
MRAPFASVRPPSPLPVLAAALLVLGLAACDSGGSTQEGRTVARTFTVTVADTTTDYAYGDRNEIGVAYAIDGAVGRTLELERGRTYEFELGDSVEGHPFYVATTPEGGGANEYTEGVENGGVQSGSVYFTPPEGAPGSLYYQCDFHVYMGGDLNVVDAGGS